MYNTGHHHIIIVDDNQDTRYNLNFSFRALQWDDNIKLIESVAQMLHYLDSLSQTIALPAVILINNNLELISCEEAMNSLKRNSLYQNIPIVVYANEMDDGLKNRLMELGAFSCHKKPSDKIESIKLAEYLKHLTMNRFN